MLKLAAGRTARVRFPYGNLPYGTGQDPHRPLLAHLRPGCRPCSSTSASLAEIGRIPVPIARLGSGRSASGELADDESGLDAPRSLDQLEREGSAEAHAVPHRNAKSVEIALTAAGQAKSLRRCLRLDCEGLPEGISVPMDAARLPRLYENARRGQRGARSVAAQSGPDLASEQLDRTERLVQGSDRRTRTARRSSSPATSRASRAA